jgi:hypothetical protein
MATRLTQSMTSGGSTTKFTKSIWVKRTGLTQGYVIDSQDDEVAIQFRDDHKLNVFIYSPSSYSTNLVSNQLFRDTNAWYHIVYAVDYTNATQAHRARVYVNGEEITSWSTETRPGNNTTTFNTFNSSITHYIGNNAAANKPFDGLMSHVIHVDGTQYAPTEFGETDSTTGEWKIKTAPSVTWGTKGYWVLKDGNSVTDQSPNSNNWTVAAGTLTKTEDCPSNVFATWNPLIRETSTGNQTYSNGNTTIDFPAGGDGRMYSTLAFSSGKFYAEFKINSFTADRGHAVVLYTDITSTGLYLSFCKTGNANLITSFGSAVQTGLASFSGGDIIGMAVDATNGTVDFTKNGSAYGSQVTGLSSNFSGKDLFFGFLGEGHPSETRVFNASANFGNGYFGTTAVSSAGTNASGIGIFEYDVPTGYTALSTKGLNL